MCILTADMFAVTSSIRTVKASMAAVTGAAWLLYLLHMLYRRYVGCYRRYGGCYSLYVRELTFAPPLFALLFTPPTQYDPNPNLNQKKQSVI